jgi:hypothetical protein
MTTWIAAIAAAAAVIATMIAWWSRRDSARSAAASERAARAAERSAKADDELRHQARTPRFELRLGPSVGDWRPAELILLGPERLEEVDFETGQRIKEDESDSDWPGWLHLGYAMSPSGGTGRPRHRRPTQLQGVDRGRFLAPTYLCRRRR